jgi:hypothetical protein
MMEPYAAHDIPSASYRVSLQSCYLAAVADGVCSRHTFDEMTAARTCFGSCLEGIQAHANLTLAAGQYLLQPNCDCILSYLAQALHKIEVKAYDGSLPSDSHMCTLEHIHLCPAPLLVVNCLVP